MQHSVIILVLEHEHAGIMLQHYAKCALGSLALLSAALATSDLELLCYLLGVLVWPAQHQPSRDHRHLISSMEQLTGQPALAHYADNMTSRLHTRGRLFLSGTTGGHNPIEPCISAAHCPFFAGSCQAQPGRPASSHISLAAECCAAYSTTATATLSDTHTEVPY